MEPVQVVRAWVARFNDGDVEGLMDLYADDGVNHQVGREPLRGRSEIQAMSEAGFERAEMTCIPEKLHDAGEWAILAWSDPNGLQGCGFFHVVDGQIVLQRGYFDQLTFFRGQGLPVPERYLGDG